MIQHRSVLTTLSAVALLVTACGGSSSGPTSPSSSLAEVESLSFQLVNQERSSNQVEPMLRAESALDRVAREYSEAMRDQGFFSHVAPDGTTLADRLAAAGISFSYAGENLARVSNAANPATYAHQLLMQNPQHRGNILSSNFIELGVGVAAEGDTIWLTQVFVHPSN